ncbi:MAG: cytochrome P450 [Streptosporangiaceae bacterium]
MVPYERPSRERPAMVTTTPRGLLYNPFDPGLRADPYPVYRVLRETDPVHRSPLGFWVISRHAEVVAIQRDPQLGFSPTSFAARAEQAGGDPAGPVARVASRWLLFTDPSRHRRFRRIMGRFFAPQNIAALRPVVAGITAELLDAIDPAEPVDLIGQLARPLPVRVLGAWLGLPDSDRWRWRAWSESIGRVLESVLNPEVMRSLSHSVLECDQYLREQLARQRSDPSDGILSGFASMRYDGQLLEDDEIVSYVSLLFGAAYETTVNLIGNGLLALIRNPGQQMLLREEPGLIASAVEEFLRYDSPAQLHGRWTFESCQAGGVEIPAGNRLIILMGSANRDPDRYADPDQLDITRPDPRPTSFSGGPHNCLGAPLARLEAQTAIPMVLDRFRTIGPVTAPLSWRAEHIAIRALTSLPVRVTH